ncbi:MAG: hypothetical protein QOI61_1005, partial [Actinomycetota bacterium]
FTDLQGRVVGMAFAIAPDEPNTAYALTSKELQAALAGPRVPGQDSGECLSNG